MKIDKVITYGFEPAIRGARNPLNSWEKSDSELHFDTSVFDLSLGKADLNLAQRLILAGNEHCKFLRQIQVWVDIDMPRYWWSEFDTYKFNTKNSCSTMHKLFDKKTLITKDMFEYELEDEEDIAYIIDKMNKLREEFFLCENQNEKNMLLKRAKTLLPEGFLQKRTVNTNYSELRNIYMQRIKHPHKLKKEWVDVFGGFIETLPYAKELIMIEKEV